jgi:hypothetical protein
MVSASGGIMSIFDIYAYDVFSFLRKLLFEYICKMQVIGIR